MENIEKTFTDIQKLASENIDPELKLKIMKQKKEKLPTNPKCFGIHRDSSERKQQKHPLVVIYC